MKQGVKVSRHGTVLVAVIVAIFFIHVLSAQDVSIGAMERKISITVREIVSKHPIGSVRVVIRDPSQRDLDGQSKPVAKGITADDGVFDATVPVLSRLLVEWQKGGFVKNPERCVIVDWEKTESGNWYNCEAIVKETLHLEVDLIRADGTPAYYQALAKVFEANAKQGVGREHGPEMTRAIYTGQWERLQELPDPTKRIVADELRARGVTHEVIRSPFFDKYDSSVIPPPGR